MGTSRRSGKKRRKKSNDNGMMMGLLIGGGGVAVVAIVVIAFMLGQQSGQNATTEVTPDENTPVENPVSSGTAQYTSATTTPTALPNNGPTTPNVSPNSQVMNSTAERPEVTTTTATLASSRIPTTTTVPDSSTINPRAETTPTYERPSEPLALPALIEQVEKSVVRIIVKNQFGGGLGSGFLVDTSGIVITNYHVIEGCTSAEAQFNDGQKAPVMGVYKVDHERDLAVIKLLLPPGKKSFLPVADGLPSKGIKVATFGAPRGLSFTTSEGIVSGLRKADEVGHTAGDFVQTTAAISGGNSGGPLVNMFGEVVGVNTFKRTDGESLNFAISCVDIQDMIATKGEKLVPLTPETVPVRISQGYGGAENLVGTERGNLLLSQIREAIIIMAPFNSDPSGRITSFVLTKAESTLERRMKWKSVRRRSQVNQSTAFVLVAMYFSLTDGQEQNLVSDLNIHTVILARDVDKEGNVVTAIVWDENQTVGKVTLSALLRGVISRSMESSVGDYFANLYGSYRRALREVEGN